METIQIQPLTNKVSRICLGTWSIGGWLWGGSEESESINTILYALEHCVNFIDTAPVYGFGTSEEIVGKAVKKFGKRDKIVIATKAGLEWQGEKVFRNSSPERIRKEIGDSLKRLGTDYIDLYQIHWPDPLTPIEKTAHTLLALQKEGLIRAIGVSNFSTKQMEEFMQVVPIQTSQPPYNLFEREIEKNIFPFTEKNKITTLAYGSICRGLLTGKMRLETKFHGDDIRKSDPKFNPPNFEAYLNAVQELNEFAKKEYQKNVLSLALRWILDRGNTVALWGARHPDQLKPLEEAMGWHLDNQAMAEIDLILKKYVPKEVSPSFMAPPDRSGKVPA